MLSSFDAALLFRSTIFSIMIPMDTVKTRIVTQTAQAGVEPYKGVLRTLSRIIREEGVGPIYRSLTPRLVSVVPMIGIQVRAITRSIVIVPGCIRDCQSIHVRVMVSWKTHDVITGCVAQDVVDKWESLQPP